MERPTSHANPAGPGTIRSDAHIHLFAGGYRGRYGRSPAGGDELAAYQDLRRVHGIERALAVGYEGQPAYRGNNRHLAGLAGEHPWLVPLAYLPPDGPARAGELADRWAEGFAGISVYLPDAEAAARFATWDSSVIRGLNRRGAILSLNATPAALALAPARDALARLAGCAILVSHLGLPGAHRRAPTRERAAADLAGLLHAARSPHVGVKISALYAISDPPHGYPHRTARPYLEVLLDAFGPGRLYWGSDFPPCLDAVSFAQALDAIAALRLPAADRRAVEHDNLARLLDHRP